MVRNNDGGRAEDGALTPLLAVPCTLAQRQQRQQRGQTAAVQKTMSCQHCQLFIALLCDGGDGSSANDRAQQRRWRLCRQQCLGIVCHSLPSHVMAITAAAGTMVRNDKRQQRRRKWCLGGIICRSLLSCRMAIMAVVLTMVRNDNSGGSTEDGALTLLLVPCFLVQRQKWWQRG